MDEILRPQIFAEAVPAGRRLRREEGRSAYLLLRFDH